MEDKRNKQWVFEPVMRYEITVEEREIHGGGKRWFSEWRRKRLFSSRMETVCLLSCELRPPTDEPRCSQDTSMDPSMRHYQIVQDGDKWYIVILQLKAVVPAPV
jgi:hypothetical protein